MVELLRPDQGRIVKIDPRDKRIAELDAALRAIEPHLHLSDDPIVGDFLIRARPEMLRMEADRIETYESAVRKVRAALNSST